jgi:hypothetical protein
MFNHYLFLIQTSIYHFPSLGGTNDHYLSVDTSHYRTNSIRSTTRSHAQSHRVTRMLILVSTCFLFLNAPSHICTISLKLYTLKRSQSLNIPHQTSFDQLNISDISTSTIKENLNFIDTTSATYTQNPSKIKLKFFHIFYIILITSQHIAYLSYSINFFLYSFCGMKFRRELTKFLSHYGKYHRHIQATRVMNSQNSF